MKKLFSILFVLIICSVQAQVNVQIQIDSTGSSVGMANHPVWYQIGNQTPVKANTNTQGTFSTAVQVSSPQSFKYYTYDCNNVKIAGSDTLLPQQTGVSGGTLLIGCKLDVSCNFEFYSLFKSDTSARIFSFAYVHTTLTHYYRWEVNGQFESTLQNPTINAPANSVLQVCGYRVSTSIHGDTLCEASYCDSVLFQKTIGACPTNVVAIPDSQDPFLILFTDTVSANISLPPGAYKAYTVFWIDTVVWSTISPNGFSNHGINYRFSQPGTYKYSLFRFLEDPQGVITCRSWDSDSITITGIQSQVNVQIQIDSIGSTAGMANHPVWYQIGNQTPVKASTNAQGAFNTTVVVSSPQILRYYTYDCNNVKIAGRDTIIPQQTTTVGGTLLVGCKLDVSCSIVFNSLFVSDTSAGFLVTEAYDTALTHYYRWTVNGQLRSTLRRPVINAPANSNLLICLNKVSTSIHGDTLCQASYCDSVLFQKTIGACQTHVVAKVSPINPYLYAFHDSSSFFMAPPGHNVKTIYKIQYPNGYTYRTSNSSSVGGFHIGFRLFVPGSYSYCLYHIITDSSNKVVCRSSECGIITVLPKSSNCASSFSSSFSGGGITNFLNQSTPSPGPTDSVAYHWDFGDGNSSTVLNPSHQYSQAGTYLVCLITSVFDTVNTILCTDTFCNNVVVTTPLGCQAVFTWSAVATQVNFSNQSVAAPGVATSYHWDFGDGNTDTTISPSHQYGQPGVYQVCLIITGVSATSMCFDTICHSVSVLASPGCQSLFTWSNASSQTSFTNQSLVSATSPARYFWDFGDGSIDSIMNPTHSYNSPGSYIACLTVQVLDSGVVVCTDVFCDTVIVSGANPFCKSLYLVDTVNSTQGNVVVWNYATPQIGAAGYQTSFSWNFGDGTTSNQPYPQHTYASAGVYPVCLTIQSIDSLQNVCTDVFCDTLGVDSLGNLIYKKGSIGFTLNVLDPWTFSIKDNPFKELSIYPNPTNRFLNIDFSSTLNENVTWQVLSLSGKVLLQNTAITQQNSSLRIDVSDLSEGLYLLQLNSSQHQQVHKINIKN